jgi:putative copper export protein
VTVVDPATTTARRGAAESVPVADEPPGTTERTHTAATRLPLAGAVIACVGVVALLGLALAVGGGGPSGAGGFDQAGLLVDWGVPVARLAARIAALGTVGALLFAAVLHPSGRTLPAASRRAVRAASVWATAWAAAGAIHALLTFSQLVGGAVTVSSLWIFVTELAAGRAALVVLTASVLVALGARRCRTTLGAALFLAVSVAGLVVPAVLTGHSAAADDHALAVTNLSVHVVAASVWVGGLVSLLVHGRDRDTLGPTAARLSSVALGCFLATGASGLLAAWLVLGSAPDGLSAALASGYGWLLIAKTAALTALGVFGWHHRRRTLSRLRAGRPGSFRRFAVVEAAVMLATVTLAVALSASPPSRAAGATSSGEPGQPVQATPSEQSADSMAGHDHGELSVSVLIDETRFHVSTPVDAASRVTVHNSTTTEVTITAADGSFDVVVPGHTLITFEAPAAPGTYPFHSRHSSSFSDVLTVR